LIAASARKGPIDLLEKQRGVGAWCTAAGDLVLHCGDRVLLRERWHRPGEHDGFIYAREAAIAPPAEIPAAGGLNGPAADLLELLRTWKWDRPALDPFLLLGWIGAAKIGGALEWRPGLYLTGDTGTGKSTLIDHLLKPLFGIGGSITVGDSTAAGIAQRLQCRTLPVIVDEFEATEDNRARQAIVELRRAAASGALRLRGSQEQEAHASQLRFCALFSAINAPPMSPQDLNRSTFCGLGGPPTGILPRLDEKKLAALGQCLTRRLVDNWPRLKAAAEAYKAVLQREGHSARSADQNGSLLAAADVLLYDRQGEMSADELAVWIHLLAAETAIEPTEAELCLEHLLNAVMDPRDPRTLGQVIALAISKHADEDAVRQTNRRLARHGLRILLAQGAHSRGFELAIASNHRGLRDLFRTSRWGGQAGQTAVYTAVLRRLPGAVVNDGTVSIGGRNARVTRVPLTGDGAILSGEIEADDA
jgi:hypothetical protein